MKVQLRRHKLSDLERLCEIFIDDSVIENLAVPIEAKDISKDDERDWIKNKIKSYKEKNPREYCLAIIADGEYVGSIGTHHVDYKKKEAEIGYWIGKNYWGRGITAQAIKKFVMHIKRKFGFKKITAVPFAYNKASQRVLEKAGFEFKREKKKSFKKHGKYFDEKLYVRELKWKSKHLNIINYTLV